MPLRYLLDEQIRGGGLWQAIQQHNVTAPVPLDVVRVGDPPDLPLGSPDPDILLWAEREGRILISRDERTLPTHLANHLQAGHRLPGLFILRRRCTLPQVVALLALIASTNAPAAWQDRIEYIP